MSEGFFDTLVSAAKGDASIRYTYDDNGMRNSKTVNDVVTYYNYFTDEIYGSRLQWEIRDGERIDYEYEFSTERNAYVPIGFRYKENEYSYVYDDGIIIGVSQNGMQVVEYRYFNDSCEEILGLDEKGCFVDRTGEEDFIGNVNPFRYNADYLDIETGWYYHGRYYSAKGNRFIDGISPERAEELKTEYPTYEVMAKTYTVGVNWFDTNARTAPPANDTEIVARVICLESPKFYEDQLAVAWVIRNRINDTVSFDGINSAVEAVKQKEQFSTYNSTEYYSFQGSAYGDCWTTALYLAEKIDYNLLPSKPTGYKNQLYFYSVNSFLKYDGINGDRFVKYDGEKISVEYWDCTLLPVGDITPQNVSAIDFSQYRYQCDEQEYTGEKAGYNIFCTKKFY